MTYTVKDLVERLQKLPPNLPITPFTMYYEMEEDKSDLFDEVFKHKDPKGVVTHSWCYYNEIGNKRRYFKGAHVVAGLKVMIYFDTESISDRQHNGLIQDINLPPLPGFNLNYKSIQKE